ncbi:MAG: zinc ABC transporter substrate-binding protein, partial [Bacteroidaceae bacterium]|nr:zinc ABC transporter substrate-binding protein [Bacteroidaceae bacterium]
MNKLFYILIIFICSACGNISQKNEKPIITVTLEPLRYFTEAIAGDNYQIVSMVPKGSNPESYDPTPQQLVNLSQSQAYFRIGHIGFEQ